jgi:pimeloyl-ACP methyl ester carboxylesterase
MTLQLLAPERESVARRSLQPVASNQFGSTKSIVLSTGVRLPYVEQGDPAGVPVLLLHGMTSSWRSFAPMLLYLPPSIHAFAITQRGHGEADRPATGYHPRDFAADVAAFLDAHQIEKAVIVGHSMGSTVALRFALDYPERTHALVPMGAFVRYATNPVMKEFVEETVALLTDPIPWDVARDFQESTLAAPISPLFLETMIAESRKAPARVWRAGFAGLFTDEHVARLGDIQAPTLLVWGDQDAFVPVSDPRHLLFTIGSARLEVYRYVGHAVHWEKPARVAADLVAFIEELDN